MPQNAPDMETTENPNTVTAYKAGTFEEYVSFCALGGLITSDDGHLSKLTVLQFCQQFDINRKTAWRWRQTPGFNERVRQRREELFPMARESAIWNRLYLIGMQSHDLRAAVEASKLQLGHFSGLRIPSKQQPESDHSESWVELLNRARKRGIVSD